MVDVKFSIFQQLFRNGNQHNWSDAEWWSQEVISQHPAEWCMKNMNCFSPVLNSSWHYFQLALDDDNCIWCWIALGESCETIKYLQMAVWADRRRASYWRLIFIWLFIIVFVLYDFQNNTWIKVAGSFLYFCTLQSLVWRLTSPYDRTENRRMLDICRGRNRTLLFYYFVSLKGIFEHPRMILQHLYALEWHFGSHINTIQIILLSPGNQHQI